MQILEKEVHIDFCRSMNKIIFDRIVKSDEQSFAFVTLPEDEEIHVREKGIKPNTLYYIILYLSVLWL